MGSFAWLRLVNELQRIHQVRTLVTGKVVHRLLRGQPMTDEAKLDVFAASRHDVFPTFWRWLDELHDGDVAQVEFPAVRVPVVKRTEPPQDGTRGETRFFKQFPLHRMLMALARLDRAAGDLNTCLRSIRMVEDQNVRHSAADVDHIEQDLEYSWRNAGLTQPAPPPTVGLGGVTRTGAENFHTASSISCLDCARLRSIPIALVHRSTRVMLIPFIFMSRRRA